jgi:hypothetical protein
LPSELTGVADRVTVILPWGSLLAAVALPVVHTLRGIRTLCPPSAVLSVVLASAPLRDRSEWTRLGLPSASPLEREAEIAGAYAAAGFTVTGVRSVAAPEIAHLPSSWARRLAHGTDRAFWRIEARAVRPADAPGPL